MEYLKRLADAELELRLQTFGATLITGPKWCGKTTTAEQQAKSVLKMQDPDRRESYIESASVKPSLLLQGEKPRLLDEWQIAPVLWDAVRTQVDMQQTEGLFILTGSTSVDNKKIMHSGTGRISRMKMYPMSLFESGESNGKISLMSLFNEKGLDIDGITSDLSVENLIFAACRGGWPASLRMKTDSAKLLMAKDYISNICETDVSTVDDVERSPVKTRAILQSYARNISTLAKQSNILSDIVANSELMTMPTLDSYLNALEKLFVIEDIDAWSPAIRSAGTIRSGKKREFTDPSIAVAALNLKPKELEMDLKTFGFIFECLCLRDLKVYSSADGGVASYYHDRYGLEADCALHLDDGRYALMEFKLGSKNIDEGASHLLELCSLIEQANKKNAAKIKLPEFTAVITGGEMAYTRKDGVKVIPIGTLRN